MKVYVAGASSEREHRAKPAIQRLREAGIEITHDWTVHVDECAAACISEGELSRYEKLACANQDLDGIDDADCVLFLVPEGPSVGAWVELGFALGAEKRVYASGTPGQKSIFLSLTNPNLRFTTDDAAIEHLIERAKRVA